MKSIVPERGGSNPLPWCLGRARGGTLVYRVGTVPDVFESLHSDVPIESVHSYEETGTALTYARDRVRAWCCARRIARAGRTGFPMVDACMRALHRSGWINFRMRAMLMSFASYHLWLHWRPTAVYLGSQF